MNKQIILIMLVAVVLSSIVCSVDYSIGVYKVVNSSTLTLNYNGTIKTFDVNSSVNLSDSFTISLAGYTGGCDDIYLERINALQDENTMEWQSWMQETYTNYTDYKEDYESCNNSLYLTLADLVNANERWGNLNITTSEIRGDKDMYSTGVIVLGFVCVVLVLIIIGLLLYYNGYVSKIKKEIEAKRAGH